MEHLNRVELIGRIGMVNATEVGNLTHYRFSLGVDTHHGDVVETTWFNCSHWGSGEKIIPGRDIHALTGVHNYAEFKEETIQSRVKKMVDLKEAFTSADDLHVRISYGNRKLGAVPSVSLIPVHDCGEACKLCSKGCYDVRNCCCYRESQAQRANNSALLKLDREKYFREIEAHVQFHRVWRWHVGGDLKDYDYLGQVVGIAVRNQHCQFLIFTKRADLVNEWLDNVGEFPSNLHLILSGWRGDKDVNPHKLPVSSPLWKDGSKSCMCTENIINCPGDCTACATVKGGCWGAKSGDTILFEAH